MLTKIGKRWPRFRGNLVGSLAERLEAVQPVREGLVKAKVFERPLRDLPAVYEQLESGDGAGRVVLKIGRDPAPHTHLSKGRSVVVR